MIPPKLYKYRSFNTKSLRLLCNAEVYYAPPRYFNDPLDCDPTIEIDIDRKGIEKLCYTMLVTAHGEKKARECIENHRYMSTEYGDYRTAPDAEHFYMRLLGLEVKRLLDAEMNSLGVLSLAARWDCPLMWSHYGDQHRGFCIEYDIHGNACKSLKNVSYNDSRRIKTSELIQWKIGKSREAERTVLHTYFFAKSRHWKYEKEWRDLYCRSGTHPAPFRISAVYFGLRCDPAVRTTIVELFKNASMAFYEIYPREDTFDLKRRLVDVAEVEACGLRSSARLDFKDIFIKT